jgi:hypothetical protein
MVCMVFVCYVYMNTFMFVLHMLWTCIFWYILFQLGARSSVVGWGILLQAGRSWVRFLMRSLDLLNLPDPSSCRGDSVSNRNEYQESSWELRAAGVWVWKPYCHLWADCLEDVGASTSHDSMGLHGLLQRELLPYWFNWQISYLWFMCVK